MRGNQGKVHGKGMWYEMGGASSKALECLSYKHREQQNVTREEGVSGKIPNFETDTRQGRGKWANQEKTGGDIT